jgi:hypothetical protein
MSRTRIFLETGSRRPGEAPGGAEMSEPKKPSKAAAAFGKKMEQCCMTTSLRDLPDGLQRGKWSSWFEHEFDAAMEPERKAAAVMMRAIDKFLKAENDGDIPIEKMMDHTEALAEAKNAYERAREGRVGK